MRKERAAFLRWSIYKGTEVFSENPVLVLIEEALDKSEISNITASMKKRMVIFGCGYLGKELASRYLKDGWEVWALSRNAETLKSITELPDAHRIVSDLQTSGWHSQLKGDFDCVVNTVSSAMRGEAGYRISYIEGNRSILEWMKERKVEHFLYTSATSVYPQSEGEWVGEMDSPENGLSVNGTLLKEAESLVLNSSSAAKTSVLRLAGIYGPGRHLFLDRLLRGERVFEGEGDRYLNLCYLDDIADAIGCVLNSEKTQPTNIFNVVDDSPVPKVEIIEWLARRLELGRVRFDPSQESARSARRKSGGELPNRRVSNAFIKETCGWQPDHASYREGYEAILNAVL